MKNFKLFLLIPFAVLLIIVSLAIAIPKNILQPLMFWQRAPIVSDTLISENITIPKTNATELSTLAYFFPKVQTDEFIKHTPLLLDIKTGQIAESLSQRYNPVPEYKFNDKGKINGLILANKANIRILYDAQDRVTKIIGPGIKVTTISYPDKSTRIVTQSSKKEIYKFSENNRKLTITNSLGASSVKEFDKHGRLVKSIDQFGDKNLYEYDNIGNLVSCSNKFDQKETYKYDINGYLTKRIDIFGNASSFSYNTSGLVSSITSTGSVTEEFEYDERGNLTTYTNPIGAKYHMEYDLINRLVKSKTPGGMETKYSYDQYNNIIEITDSSGKRVIMKYDEVNNLITKSINGILQNKYSYDIYGRLIQQEDALGNITRCIYDKNDNLESITYPNNATYKYEYDANNNITSMTNPLGETTKYEYSPIGLPSKTIYSNGTSENYTYNDSGQLVSKKDTRGNIDLYVYNGTGNLKSTTDTRGNTTFYKYDNLSRLINVSYPTGETTSYKYNDKENSVITKNQDGLETTHFYDKLNRVVKIIDFKNNTTQYSYNSDGTLIKTIDSLGNITTYNNSDNSTELQDPFKGTFTYNYDPSGRLSSIKNKLGNLSTQEYDPIGRLIKTKNIMGHSIGFTYDSTGNIKSNTDYNGNITNYTYDTANRLTKVVDPSGYIFNISYDNPKNTQRVTDSEKNLFFEYKFNPFGDIAEKTYGSGANLSYKYNPYGNIESIRKKDGSFIKNSYDKFNRLTKVTASNGTEDNFSYNKNGNLIVQENNSFKETYKYDKWQRLTQATRNDLDLKVKYQYDHLDRISNLTYPSGREFTYHYNNSGKLEKISSDANLTFLFSYDQAGRLENIKYPNEISAAYEYEPLGRLVSLKYKTKKDKIITGFLYNYDHEGNVTSIKKHNSPETKYAYDSKNQLISHMPPETKCSYDSNGNVSDIESMKLIYDVQDRLKTIKLENGKDISYGYSPTHKRIWKETDKNKTHFIYSGDYVIAEVKDGVITSEYLYGPLIDQPLQMTLGKDTYYYHADRIGSINAITNTNQEIVAEYEYDPYGNLIKSSGSITNPYRYTAREYESEANIYYYRNRYYSPALGQFLTKDLVPEDLQNPLTFDPYIYANNNPLRYKDPFGLSGGGARFMDLAEGIDRPLNLSGLPGGRPVDYNIGTDAAGNKWYYNHGRLLPNSNMVIHPTKGYLPNTPQNVQSAMEAMDRGIPQMSDQQASRIWSAQNPRLVDRTRTAAQLDASLRPQPIPPSGGQVPPNTPSPGIGRRFMQGASRLGGNISNFVGRIPGRIFAAANPLLVPFYGLNVGTLAGAGTAGASVLSAGAITAGAVGVAGGTMLNQLGPVRRGATAALTPVAGLLIPSNQSAQAGPRGQAPSRGDVTAQMTQMINTYGQLQQLLNDTNLWSNTIRTPNGPSLQSQAASASTVSSSLTTSHQQDINRIRDQRAELQEYQDRVRSLIDSYVNNGGHVNNDWMQSSNSTMSDLQTRIRNLQADISRNSHSRGSREHSSSDSGSSSSSSSSSSSGCSDSSSSGSTGRGC